MKSLKPFRIVFWIILAFCLVFFVTESTPATANLGGSKITFASGAGGIGETCYIPGRSFQNLCFDLDTVTTDGQDATNVAMQFPSDWDVRGFLIEDPPGNYYYQVYTLEQSCTEGNTIAPHLEYWGESGAGYEGQDFRVQLPNSSCHAIYCFMVQDETDPGDPPYSEPDASVSWAWAGAGWTTGSEFPCSEGTFTPPWNTCDSRTEPPASVPVCEFVPITITPESLPHAIAGKFYTQQLSPTNSDTSNPTYSYSYSGEMPAGSSLYTNTGEFYWGNPILGSYTFTVSVRGPGWSEGSRTYTLVVDPELVFTPNLLPLARKNIAYDQAITVQGGAEPYVLSLESGTLPSGISFNDGAFTGTPTETGTFNDIVIQAVDNNGITQSDSFNLTVLEEHLFSWTPLTPTSGEETTFTAVTGFNSYAWYYGPDPDGDCSNYVYNYEPYYTASISFWGRGQHKVCLRLYKSPYPDVIDEQWVTVTNFPPDIYSAYLDPYLSFPGQEVAAVLNFSDVDGGKSFTCTIDWGDGSAIEPGTVEVGSWNCTLPHHTYLNAGSYQVVMSVTDDESATKTNEFTHKVVYLYTENDDPWLASNLLPTTITLYGYAPLGTQTMQFNITSVPAHGTVGSPILVDCTPDDHDPRTECWATVLFNPTITNPLYVGPDQFTYTVQDTDGHISAPPADVDLWLTENEPPVADASSATVLAQKPSLLFITGTDLDEYDYAVDQVSFHIDSPPSNGVLSFEGEADVSDWLYPGAHWIQMLLYTPNPGTTATSDSFTFHVNDSHQNSQQATVTLELYTPTTLHVNVNDDVIEDPAGCTSTHCSLREAVNDAKIGDIIDFTLSLPNTITLTWDGGGELLINKNIQILGPGPDLLTISAGFTDPATSPSEGFRVIHIDDENRPLEVVITGLTVRDGRAEEGGGVLVDDRTSLTMTDCVIGPNNIVSYAGGGISVQGDDVTLNNCTVIGNHGTGSEGGAGIFVRWANLTITNSTITGNVTNNFGGGILADSGSNVSIIHSTVSGNTANLDHEQVIRGGGGGIYIQNAEKVELWNTIVAGNIDLTDPSDPDGHDKWPDVRGAILSQSGNLIGDGTGSTGWVAGDQLGGPSAPLDPKLGILDVHAPGHTPIYPLLTGSPAIDAVPCPAGVIVDQRGITRPQGIYCDIGAYELETEWRYLYLPLLRR